MEWKKHVTTWKSTKGKLVWPRSAAQKRPIESNWGTARGCDRIGGVVTPHTFTCFGTRNSSVQEEGGNVGK